MSIASVVAAWLVLSGSWLFPSAGTDDARTFVGARLYVGPGIEPIEVGAWRCRGPAVL